MRCPPSPAWPGLAVQAVVVGGVTCTVADACAAARTLAASGSSAIRQLLRAAGNPLSACDYWAAAGPYLAAARAPVSQGGLEPTHRRGCAGRHVAKTAFCEALCDAVESAARSFWAAAMKAFGSDERYAAQMAEDAVSVRRNRYARHAREQLRQAGDAAMAVCRASAGQFSCGTAAACGTGSCRFADPRFARLDVPAPAGRTSRPANHAAGGTWSENAALAAWLEEHPWKPRITVSDCDACVAADREAA